MTIKRYSYTDPIIKEENDTLQELSVEKSNNPILRVFRILSGTVNIKDEFLERNYNLRTNYFNLPNCNVNRVSQKSILENFADDLKLLDINVLFKKAKNNYNFYETIETETIKCLLARNNQKYLESFLFVYRLIEGISYSLPLIYTSKATNYKKSFQALQSFMSKNNSNGEIKFFKNFVAEIYSDEAFFRSTIDIDLNLIPIEELREPYYNLYKSNIEPDYITEETENEELKVNFLGFLSFMVTLRNRYFHFLQGSWQENLSSSQVIHPDMFFMPIVDHGINWVAIVLFEVMKYDFESS